ncbi:MAG: hemolysin family protein [Lachnospiraceae bacterium]|nr:hemolysin family protein [Lachnospiraceae bacterium]
MDPAGQYIILFILIVLSAFFSSAETALTSVNKLKIRSLAEDGHKKAKMVFKLIEKPDKMLSAILIGNNIVNISASSLATTIAVKLLGSMGAGIATGVLTLIILVFGEITPKSLATRYPEKFSFFYVPLISALTFIFTPIIYLVNALSRVIVRLFEKKGEVSTDTVTEDELLTMVDVSHEEGVIESEEREMITNIVDFGDSLAKDVMVPRIDMAFANIDMTYNELVAAFEKDMYTRLPVYKESIDDVVGVISLKDVFFYKGNKKDFKVADFMREPFFTYESKKTSELLRELKKATNPVAIVLDEYGVTAGLITIEDLVEEIVGEIRDEYDEDEEDDIIKVGDNTYKISGLTKLDELSDSLGLKIESDEYDSIAGHVIHLLGHLPAEGEKVEEDGCTYEVLTMDKNRIDKILLTLPGSKDGENESEKDTDKEKDTQE